MFLILKKRWIYILTAIIISCVFCFSVCKSVFTGSQPSLQKVIVIDAGHGGDDGGAVGQSGVIESELNLKYSQQLKVFCEEVGLKVVMTRSDMNGLYSPTAKNKKRSEMEKREKIINGCGADIMVSLHMNSFSLPSCKGAQVFYGFGDEEGKSLATSVQDVLYSNIPNAKKSAGVGDYYVLNCAKMPAILVECGYISCPEEEKLLCEEEYRKNFCQNLLVGILNFLGA